MEAWARRYGDKAQFLCVCVESQNVAEAFSRMFDLQAAVNGFIPGRPYMPVGYGQLGCSGFIISDAAGCFVSRKTQAYLQYGEDAFAHVEEILARELNVRPPPPSSPNNTNGTLHPDYPYQVGSRAVLEGITKAPSLNGLVVIIQAFDRTSGRFHVQLEADTTKLIAVLPCSVAPYKPNAEGQCHSASDAVVLTSIAVPPSVGVASMDQEHYACTSLLNELLQDPVPEKLKTVLGALEKHFEHEEQLMQKHGFGGGDNTSSSFSPLVSHSKDHNRILEIGRKALAASC